MKRPHVSSDDFPLGDWRPEDLQYGDLQHDDQQPDGLHLNDAMSDSSVETDSDTEIDVDVTFGSEVEEEEERITKDWKLDAEDVEDFVKVEQEELYAQRTNSTTAHPVDERTSKPLSIADICCQSDTDAKNARQYEQLVRMYANSEITPDEEKAAKVAADAFLAAVSKSARVKSQGLFKVQDQRLVKGDGDNMGSCDPRYLDDVKLDDGRQVQKYELLLSILMKLHPKFKAHMKKKGAKPASGHSESHISIEELKAMATEVPVNGTKAERRAWKKKWKKKIGIYVIVTPDGRCFYVGSTRAGFMLRWQGHKHSEGINYKYRAAKAKFGDMAEWKMYVLFEFNDAFEGWPVDHGILHMAEIMAILLTGAADVEGGLNYNVADTFPYFFLARKMTTANFKKMWKLISREDDGLPRFNADDGGVLFAARLDRYHHLHNGCSPKYLYSLLKGHISKRFTAPLEVTYPLKGKWEHFTFSRKAAQETKKAKVAKQTKEKAKRAAFQARMNLPSSP